MSNKNNHIKTAYNLRYRPAIMSSLSAAHANAARCLKTHVVILGDNGKYWVVSLSDAQRLQKHGYEIAY